MIIEYRYEGQEVAGRMSNLEMTKDAAVVVAQKYMKQFPAIVSAHVFTGETETVVSRATEWQKRNG